MGLGFHAIDAIGREHRFKPIRGDALFVGRQTVYFTPSELAAHLRDHGISVDPTAIEIDRSTVHRCTEPFTIAPPRPPVVATLGIAI